MNKNWTLAPPSQARTESIDFFFFVLRVAWGRRSLTGKAPFRKKGRLVEGWQPFPKQLQFQLVPTFSGNAIQAFGNGTDVGVWQPQPPLKPTVAEPSVTRRVKDRNGNALDALPDFTKLDLNGNSLYHNCGTLQVSFWSGELTRWMGLIEGLSFIWLVPQDGFPKKKKMFIWMCVIDVF